MTLSICEWYLFIYSSVTLECNLSNLKAVSSKILMTFTWTPLQTTHCLFCQSHHQHIYFAWNPILSEANLVDTAPSDVWWYKYKYKFKQNWWWLQCRNLWIISQWKLCLNQSPVSPVFHHLWSSQIAWHPPHFCWFWYQ